MRLSLRLRFVLVTIAIASVTLAGIALFSRRVTLQEIERVTTSPPSPRRDPESLRLPLVVYWNKLRSWAGVLPLLERLAGDSSKLLLVSAEGNTLAAWPPDLASARVVLHLDQSLEIDSRTAAGESRRMVLRGAPGVSLPGATLYILPAEPPAGSRTDVRHSINRSLLFAVLFAFAFALLAALALSRYILRPIRALTAAAGRVAGGRFDQRVPQQGRDELGSLAASFNAMADRLAHTEQLRRNMVGDISHELRTPLTRMQCQVEAMQDGLAPSTPEALRHIHEQIRVLERLVDDLQDLSLSDAGQLKLNPAPLRIDELIRTVVKSQPIQLDLAPNLPPVLADARRIRQILQNLIDNALRCGPEDATVTVSARCQGTWIEVRVQDRGIGIPPEQLALIFERFHRVDDSRARSTGGTGLGLAIVRQLVVAHGGRVWAESTQGVGTTLIFTLPTIA